MKKITPQEIKEIINLSESCPEKYQEKCFELLLQNLLTSKTVKRENEANHEEKKPSKEPPQPTEFVMPIDVKAFLSQYSFTEQDLKKLFFIAAEDIRPTYKLTTTKKAVAQIQHTLIMCLENAIKEGKFTADVEAIRQRCHETKCYDSANFMAVFKKNKNLFKDIEAGEPLSLSPDGKSELADVLEQIARLQ